MRKILNLLKIKKQLFKKKVIKKKIIENKDTIKGERIFALS